MRALLLSVLGLLVALIPSVASAMCSNTGATIVYVNGILTKLTDAENDLFALENKFYGSGGNKDVGFQIGYNPSHLDGYGDELESVSQTFDAPISDYDLDTILDQIAPNLQTRKVLLLGHSQGTFYTNEMYDYLVKNGVPPQSVAVYNIATPANFVAGGGSYLTSGNDKLINQVRVWDAEAAAPGPLPANILIPPQPGDDADIYGGHHLAGDYLAGAASRVVSDIEASLAKLTASGTSSDACYKTPPLGLAYDAQEAVFALADPAAAAIDLAASKTTSVVEPVVSTAISAGSALNQAVNAAVSNAFFSIFPKPDAQNAGAAFAVEKALYGSSLSEADYEALVQGDDLPTEQPQPQSEPQQVQTAQPQKVSTSAVPSPAPVPPTPPITPSTSSQSQPFSNIISMSPGFGGGEPLVDAVSLIQANSNYDTASSVQQSSDDEMQATSTNGTASSTAETSDDQTEATSTAEIASSTPQTSDEGTQATSTSDTDSAQPVPISSCGQPALATTGDFFSGKDDAEYSPNGLLEYHFENLQDRGFMLAWTYLDDQCGTSGPIGVRYPLPLNLPVGVRDWGVRFTSMTHFDVLDDADSSIIGSYDIPVTLPAYTSIAFEASAYDYADDYSVFVSRGLKISAGGKPPSFSGTVAAPASCPGITAIGYFFDPTFEQAEYVDGLLRVHLRLLTPYNDGRFFRAMMLSVGSDCSIPPPPIAFSYSPLQTSLTPYVRYYSFRMASSTHWVLWDDENNLQIQCGSGCEGDVQDGASFVSFLASFADDNTLRTTPYPPTSQ